MRKIQRRIATVGPEGREPGDSSGPATARRNRQVFEVAEQWRLVDQTDASKVLVIGHEAWPLDPARERCERLAFRHRRRQG